MPAALLIPGLVFFGAIVLLALAQTANVHTKAQTEAQQSFWGFLGDALTGRATVNAITKATRSALSRWALAQLRPVTAWFVALNALVLNIFRTQTQVLEGTATAIEQTNLRLRSSTTYKDGSTVKAKASTASSTAATAKTAAHATSTSLHNYRVATRPKIAHATHAVDVAIPQQLGRIRTRTNTLERGQTNLRDRTKALEDGALDTWKWIRSHPLSGVTSIFAGAVAIALARLGYGFLRCRAWRNVGKRLTCGNGNSLLNALEGGVPALLSALLTAELLLNFEELVKLAQNVEHDTAKLVQEILKV